MKQEENHIIQIALFILIFVLILLFNLPQVFAVQIDSDVYMKSVTINESLYYNTSVLMSNATINTTGIYLKNVNTTFINLINLSNSEKISIYSEKNSVNITLEYPNSNFSFQSVGISLKKCTLSKSSIQDFDSSILKCDIYNPLSRNISTMKINIIQPSGETTSQIVSISDNLSAFVFDSDSFSTGKYGTYTFKSTNTTDTLSNNFIKDISPQLNINVITSNFDSSSGGTTSSTISNITQESLNISELIFETKIPSIKFYSSLFSTSNNIFKTTTKQDILVCDSNNIYKCLMINNSIYFYFEPDNSPLYNFDNTTYSLFTKTEYSKFNRKTYLFNLDYITSIKTTINGKLIPSSFVKLNNQNIIIGIKIFNILIVIIVLNLLIFIIKLAFFNRRSKK